MTVDIQRRYVSSQFEGSGTMISGAYGSSRALPLQSRNTNGVPASFSSLSHDEYNSREMAALNRMSKLEDSNNENNKRVTSSSQGGSSHARRNMSNSEREPEPSSTKSSSSLPRQNGSTRSSSVSSSNVDTGDDVIIEEKRRRVNGDGYTIHRYLRGRLLGKGGFAKVYLCTALDTNKNYAVKIVPKSNLVKARARQKLQAEIKIHRTLKHKHICEYKHFFEDRQNCYILLELCHNQSMNEMIKRRQRLTEPETIYFMRQLVDAIRYLHDECVIHRDLKLGNLFLDRNMNIKVGDLGLATKLESPDEKRKTICGTPNYIAPEVIQGDKSTRCHSFEVDIWSMGVILYTSLVGKPPYEAKDVKATYQRILANEYTFPRDNPMSSNAKDLIRSMLQSRPEDRPSLSEISAHPFFGASAPSWLPPNATHVAPVWHENEFGELISVTKSDSESSGPRKPSIPRSNSHRRPLATRDPNIDRKQDRQMKPQSRETIDMQGVMKTALAAVIGSNNGKSTPSPTFQVFDENQQPPRPSSTTSSHGRLHGDDLVEKTAYMSIKTHQEPETHTPSRVYPSPRTQQLPADATSSHEHDAVILRGMLDRISCVLDITSKRTYSPNSQSLSMTPFTRGGPTKWVNRYVDYTSKYGLGFLLSDGSSGVYFNDSTKAVMEANGGNFLYIERRKTNADGTKKGEPFVASHTLDEYPDDLQKKVTLLKHFRNYLIDQQKKSADDDDSFHGLRSFRSGQSPRSSSNLVYLKKWVRTKHAIFFRLSDQTAQIVFYDHTEVLLTPDERHITYVDKQKNRTTYYLTDELVGCNPEIAKRVKYTKEILQQLVSGQKR